MVDPINSDALREIVKQLTEMYERIYGTEMTEEDRQVIEFWAHSFGIVSETRH